MLLTTRRSLLIGGAASAGVAAVALGRSPALALLDLDRPQTRSASKTFDVHQFGARGDGRGDDRAAIQSAIDAAARAGGATVLVPAGTYIVSRAANSAVALTLRSGVTLQGQGPASLVKLQDGVGGHLVNVTRETNCGIRDLTLDGNRARQSSVGHAFRSGGVVGLQLRNLLVRNAFHYGIGLEEGTNSNIVIDNVAIEDIGGDGIDIKNRGSADSGIQISNVTVRRWGLRSDRDTQAGIDCRGRVRLSNIRVEQPGADDAVGIRMRQGEIGDVNGRGGHDSTLNGFQIVMGDGPAQVGINIVARGVSIANGSVTGGARGVLIQEAGFHGAKIQVSRCSKAGFLIEGGRSRYHGTGATLSNCVAMQCGGDGFEVDADQVQIIDCVSRGSRGHGVLVRETASGTRILGGDFSGNAGGPIANHAPVSRL